MDRYLTVYFKARGVVWGATAAVRSKRLEKLPLAVLQCKRRLPANAEVALVWGAGIAADSGIATTEEQTWTYKTRPEFTARFSCDRMKTNGGCIPFLPSRLEFTAPVRMADALAVKLTGPGGKVFKASVNKEEAKADYVNWLTIEGSFPEKSKLMLSLPAGLKDDANRALLNQARFPMAVRTDAQPPLVKFPARFGIIEAKGDRLLPVTVRNVEASLAARMANIGTAINGAMLRVNDGGTPQDQQDQQIIEWLKRMAGGSGWEAGDQWGDALFRPLLSDAKAARDIKSGAVERFTMPKPGG